jgi:hypothetical protein
MRRLEPQAAAERRQPHADRGGGADRLQQSNDWVDLGRHFHPAPGRLHTWWSYRSPDWTKNDRGRGSIICGRPRTSRRSPSSHHVTSPAATGPAVRPRAARHRVRHLSDGRDVARAIDALRRGWPVAIDGTASSRSKPPMRRRWPPSMRRAGRHPHLRQPRGDAEARQPARRGADRAGADRRAPGSTLPARPRSPIRRSTSHAAEGAVPDGPAGAARACEAALRLARLAGLLPALFIGGVGEGAAQCRADRHHGRIAKPPSLASPRAPSCRRALPSRPRSSPSARRRTRPSMSRC